VAAAVAVAFVLYSSSSGTRGIVESITRSTRTWAGVSRRPHVKPFDYYIGMLAYSSSAAWFGPKVSCSRSPRLGCRLLQTLERLLARYLALYTVMVFLAFSAIRYKRRELLRSMLAPSSWRLRRGSHRRRRPLACSAYHPHRALLRPHSTSGPELAREFPLSGRPRNPYVYAQTVPTCFG